MGLLANLKTAKAINDSAAEPMSDRQWSFVRGLCREIDERRFAPAALTKGEASSFIDALKIVLSR